MKIFKEWISTQAIIVLTLIILIYIYIAYDVLVYKPRLNKELDKITIEIVRYDTISINKCN
jgi:hypothetical protein